MQQMLLPENKNGLKMRIKVFIAASSSLILSHRLREEFQ